MRTELFVQFVTAKVWAFITGLQKRLKEGRRVGRLLSLKKKEGFRYAVTGGGWHGEAGGRLVRSQESCGIGLGDVCLSMVGPELGRVTKKKKKKKNHQLSIKSYPFWTNCFQDWVLAPGLVALEVEARLLFLFMVWTLSVCIFSPSEVLVPTIF